MSDNNNNATSSPTATPNKCQELEPGDITIFLLNSDILDTFVFFPLVDIYPEVGSLYVTDNAWTGKEFLKEEGTVQVGLLAITLSAFSINWWKVATLT